MTPIEIKITLDISERMEAIAQRLLQQVGQPTSTNQITEPKIEAKPSSREMEMLDAVIKETAKKMEFEMATEKPTDAPTEKPAEKPADAPKEKQEEEKSAYPTAEDVRRGMDEVRDKYEFGEVPAGATKGTNPTADKIIHKMLTTAFKMIANKLEEGKKPSELLPENRQEFILLINQLSQTPDGFEILPF